MRTIPSTFKVSLYKLLNPTYIKLMILLLLVIASFAFPQVSLACDMGNSGGNSCGGGLY
jgi:hypothetical protein